MVGATDSTNFVSYLSFHSFLSECTSFLLPSLSLPSPKLPLPPSLPLTQLLELYGSKVPRQPLPGKIPHLPTNTKCFSRNRLPNYSFVRTATGTDATGTVDINLVHGDATALQPVTDIVSGVK